MAESDNERFLGNQGGDDSPQIRIERSLEKYLTTIIDSGVINGLLIGTVPGLRMGFVWNIYTQDFTQDEIDGKVFEIVDKAIYTVKRELADILPLRIQEVFPLRLEELRSSCESRGITLTHVSF